MSSFGSFDSGSGSSGTMSEINMVPLIDVMLVLLVIFIITAPLLSHSLKINVPQASTEPIEQKVESIDLAVDEQGQIFWNEELISFDEMEQRLAMQAALDPQPDLRIRADLNTRYEVLAQIMAKAKKSGMKRMGFVTRPSEAAAGAADEAAGQSADKVPASSTP